MIVVLDVAQARADVAAGRLTCGCGRPFMAWGYARPRSIRQAGGAALVVRPARVRCRGCEVTHVLLPAACAPRSGYATDVVGPALVAGALGAGHRAIAAELDVPADTVRGWLRRARQAAESLRSRAMRLLVTFDPDPPALVATGTALGDALNALLAAAVAAARHTGKQHVPLWHLAAVLAGRLPPPLHSG